MQLEEVKPGSFIYRRRQALENNFCDDVVARFEHAVDEQYPGRIGQDQQSHADIKKTVDLRVSGKPQWADVDSTLFESLRNSLSEVCAVHPFFSSNSFKDHGYNLQRYRAGEYYRWHVDAGPGPFSQRQLVAIWYLNNVDGPGGETEFAFQDIKIKPTAGDLLLFPPFWTHVHRSIELQAGSKYIATTWVCFS
ncbi:MAG: hypothetical protein DHS20C01_19290 [marine bacterium B5-7]|nr:MAG: hypothetical protein DHS20C01_19290 [marine bacterium B5-7]